ncbi:MAG: hypothetical protein WC239_05680 [Sphaerochaetaceae bacterium]
MKNRALLALILIMVLVLIGCTGCDSDPKSVDLTQTREILTNSEGWVAQEEYVFETGEEYYKILVTSLHPQNITVYNVVIMGSNEVPVDMARIEYTEAGVTFKSDVGSYSLRITSEADTSNPVLTLTSASGEKMYFSMGGSA